MPNSHQIEMEIAGNTAMWTRPDTGDCPVSYPAPTYSSIEGIFKSILWGSVVQIIPIKVEICAPIQYHNYHTNYGGPLRKAKLIKSGDSFQLLATVLTDVCYKLYAEVAPISKEEKIRIPDKAKQWDKRTTSPGHAYRDIFYRRLERGQCFTIPFLGWKEFTPNYFGSLRETSKIQSEINITIPSMLREVFSNGYASQCAPVFDSNVKIINGVLTFPKRKPYAE